VGWAAGIERILLASQQASVRQVPDVFVVVAKPEAAGTAFGLATKLRERGLHAELEQAGRSVKGQFKHADRLGARRVVIVGDGIEVKDMASGEQREVAGVDEAVAAVAP
jgi:histidyl-tRNA synthetase